MTAQQDTKEVLPGRWTASGEGIHHELDFCNGNDPHQGLAMAIGKADFKSRAERIRERLEVDLPKPEFELALAAEDGAALMAAAPTDSCGLIVFWLYYRLRAGECQANVFRDALNEAWKQDHDVVIKLACDRRRLRALFQHAGFAVPREPSPHITIWRGTCDEPFSKARRGLSWTTERDCACWFALRFSLPRPLVLKAVVPVGDVFHLPKHQQEFEVIWFGGGGEIDGNLDNWRTAANRWLRNPASPDYLKRSLD